MEFVCGACAWARSYPLETVIERLRARRWGDGATAVGTAAHWVQWPCPACKRMRWSSRVVLAER